MSAYQHLTVERDGPVLVVAINRPEVMNAMNQATRDELVVAFTEAQADDSVRAVVLTGTGTRAFSAGQDLNEARHFTAEQGRRWIEQWRRVYEAIRDLEKPLVAAVNGVAAGAAFQLCLLCDIRILAEGARFTMPEVNIGVPATMGTWLLWDMVGRARTVELVLTGRLVEADEAVAWGLAGRIVPADRVRAEAVALARELAGKPPGAVRLNKRHWRALTQPGFDYAEEAGKALQLEAYGSGEPQACMAAFLERRRKPA